MPPDEKLAVSELCCYFSYFPFYFILRTFEHRVGSAPWVLRFPRSSRNCRSDQPEIMTPSLLSGPGPGFLCVYNSQQALWGKTSRRGEVTLCGVSTCFSSSHHPTWLLQAPPHSSYPSKVHLCMTDPRPSHACVLREDRFPQGGEWSLVSTHLIVLLSM